MSPSACAPAASQVSSAMAAQCTGIAWATGGGGRSPGCASPANTARSVAVVSRKTSRGSRHSRPARAIICALFGPSPSTRRPPERSAMVAAAMASVTGHAGRHSRLPFRSRFQTYPAIPATVVTASLLSTLDHEPRCRTHAAPPTVRSTPTRAPTANPHKVNPTLIARRPPFPRFRVQRITMMLTTSLIVSSPRCRASTSLLPSTLTSSSPGHGLLYHVPGAEAPSDFVRVEARPARP